KQFNKISKDESKTDQLLYYLGAIFNSNHSYEFVIEYDLITPSTIENLLKYCDYEYANFIINIYGIISNVNTYNNYLSSGLSENDELRKVLKLVFENQNIGQIKNILD